mgnify:CR=1 FL=1
MLNINEILETVQMIQDECLDIRTTTMGISLIDCADSDIDRSCRKVYDKITSLAEKLVATGEGIERKYGIPIINKRVAVTPIAMLAGVSGGDPVKYAHTLQRAADTIGVNFIGGFSALVQKGMTPADLRLIRAIPQALAETELVCASVNIGSTKAGINMDAVALMGETVKETARLTADRGGFGCAKLVVFCNAVEDNPFMAGAFHGVSEPDRVINVGVSGPGVVHHALKAVKGQSFDVVAETIKKTAFQVTRMGQLVAQEASRRLGVPFGIVDLSLGIFLDHGVQLFLGCFQLLGAHDFRLGIVFVNLGRGQFSRGSLRDGLNQLSLDGLGFLDSPGYHDHDADGFRSFHLYCAILVNGSILKLYFIRHGERNQCRQCQ